jgi:biotin operon repressor
MSKKQMGQMDLVTGELLEGLVVLVPKKKTNGFVEGWFAVANQAGAIVAKSDLGLGEHRVLWMLFSHLDFENHLAINQAEIARELGMQRQHVQRAIKRLMELEVLIEGKKNGQNRTYQLNPTFGWKGSAKNHLAALKAQRKARMKAAKITGVVKTPPSETNPEK